mmetsp:Transcript_9940/g.28194  ORF Transcript_9940/g.28194 Transcript_9940/m.28194 type:complete len:99 (+) Transcript_9940:151-447(+)
MILLRTLLLCYDMMYIPHLHDYNIVARLMPIRCSNQIPFRIGLFSSRFIASKPEMILPKQGSPKWICVLSSVLMKKEGLPSAANPTVYLVCGNFGEYS